MSALRDTVESSESRVAPRQRVMLAGKLSFHNGSLSVACTVLQLSSAGARASVEGDLPVAQTFEISIPQRNIQRKGRLVWRRGALIGLAFDDLDAAPAPTGKSDGLEAENQRLKALVAKLEARLKEMQEGY